MLVKYVYFYPHLIVTYEDFLQVSSFFSDASRSE